MLIGREKEQQILKEALTDEYSQFIAVYGRRRVGKTFLIRESYDYHFTFQFTGAAKTHTKKQLARFRMALKEHGLTDLPPVLTNWMTAFSELMHRVPVFFPNLNLFGTDGLQPEKTSSLWSVVVPHLGW